VTKSVVSWECDDYNRKKYTYMCLTTNQPDTKSNPNPYPKNLKT